MRDPRENIDHIIETGQTYKDDRTGDLLRLIFLDDLNYLLRGIEDEIARLGNRKEFEKEIGAGRYKVTGNVKEVTGEAIEHGDYTTIDWTQVDGVGETTAVALQNAGYTTDRDLVEEDDEALLEIRGVGAGNLKNMREYVQ